MGDGPGGPARNPGTGCFINRYRHVTARIMNPPTRRGGHAESSGFFPWDRAALGAVPPGTRGLYRSVIGRAGPAGARSSRQGLLVIHSGSGSLSSYGHAERKDT
jgi:hypothetical protein